MRWIWIDKFVHFERGKSAAALKNLTLAEEHLHDAVPHHPVMPHSLIIEGLAQTGGILVGDALDFREKVVLAKLPRVEVRGVARPGDRLMYRADVVDLREQGAVVRAVATRLPEPESGDAAETILEAEIFFAFLDQSRLRQNFGQVNFVFEGPMAAILESLRPRAGGSASKAPAPAEADSAPASGAAG